MHTLKPSIDTLYSKSGAKATLSWQSIVKLTGGKSNAMQGRIRKVSTAPIMFGGTGIYAMKKVQEGEFDSVTEVNDRPWGTRRGNSCIVDHKGAEYVEFYIEGQTQTTYYLDDVEIDKEDIIGLPPKKDSEVKIACTKHENILVISDSAEKSVTAGKNEKVTVSPKDATVIHVYRGKDGKFIKKPSA